MDHRTDGPGTHQKSPEVYLGQIEISYSSISSLIDSFFDIIYNRKKVVKQLNKDQRRGCI